MGGGPGRFDHLLRGNTGKLLDPLQVIFRHLRSQFLDILGTGGDELLVFPTIVEDNLHHAVEKRNV